MEQGSRTKWQRCGLVAVVSALITVVGTLVSGCVTETLRPEPRKINGPSAWAEPQVYDCGEGVRFTVAFEASQAWLLLPDETIRLLPVRSASGAQYEGQGVTFWGQGDEALLILPTERHTDCRVDPRATVWAAAKLRGVDFRAMGNEPGWYTEIYENQRIVLVTDYGTKWHELSASPPEKDVAQGITRYRSRYEDKEVVIELENKPCTDSMNGEEFEVAVRATVGPRAYYGCGRYL